MYSVITSRKEICFRMRAFLSIFMKLVSSFFKPALAKKKLMASYMNLSFISLFAYMFSTGIRYALESSLSNSNRNIGHVCALALYFNFSPFWSLVIGCQNYIGRKICISMPMNKRLVALYQPVIICPIGRL